MSVIYGNSTQAEDVKWRSTVLSDNEISQFHLNMENVQEMFAERMERGKQSCYVMRLS